MGQRAIASAEADHSLEIVGSSKANEALARHKRLFDETPQVQVNISTAGMSNEALDARIRELLSKQNAGGEVVDGALVGESKLLPEDTSGD